VLLEFHLGHFTEQLTCCNLTYVYIREHWRPPWGYGKTFQRPSSIFNKPIIMVGRRQTPTSSGSELEDDANLQLAQLLEAVRELQEQNVEQHKQNDEHQRQ
jgi:hypothetical protein